MLKHISDWFSKNTQTKVTVILVLITAVSVYVAIREYRLNQQLADRAKVEKIVIQFEGGVTYSDSYKTRFTTSPSMSKVDKTIMPTRWPMIVSNNGQNTVSLVAYNAWSRIHGRKRNIGTNILDNTGRRISLPVVLSSGKSLRLFLEVPIHIPTFVFELVKDVGYFAEDFAPAELEKYLKTKHSIDFYGNPLRYAKKISGAGDESVPYHLFGFSTDGNLRKDLMQTDQVTIEFKTARDNYFTTRALYYDIPTFKPKPVKYLQRGRPADITVKLESIDSLPKTEDAKVITHE